MKTPRPKTGGRQKGIGAGYPPNKSLPMEERIRTFWTRVNKLSDSECWNWTHPADKETGYGRLGLNTKLISAHRFSWLIHFGDIPEGMCVCHHCDNRICVNPKHLFLGTIADNNADMKRKGRMSKAPRNNKISPEDVVQIRKMWIPFKMSVRKISKILNLNYKSCETAVSRKHWQNIPWTTV